MSPDHEQLMHQALEEAATGGADGNPAVGSVIVRDGVVVARGRNLVTSIGVAAGARGMTSSRLGGRMSDGDD